MFQIVQNQNTLRDDREMRGSINGNSSGTSTSTLGSSTTEVHRNNGSISASGNMASVAAVASASTAAAAAAAVASTSAVANRGEEEWKNIHTMLNCISAMVDKTKRAITILQQRGVETTSNLQASAVVAQHTDTSIAEMKRQTEEKVAEFRRNAEEAVNQVKRQAVIEIQRAVAAAESRAIEAMAQERLKLEKMFAGRH